MKQEQIPDILPGSFNGRFQVARPGSYAIVDKRDYGVTSTGLDFTAYFQPYLLEAGHAQTLVSTLDISTRTGYAIVLDDNGMVEFWVGIGTTVEVISTNFKPALKTWVKVHLIIQGAHLAYELRSIASVTEIVSSPVTSTQDLTHKADISQACILTFGASYAKSPDGASGIANNFFSGRLDSPTIKSLGSKSRILAQWDFSREMAGDKIIDVSGSGAEGLLINAPTRAVTGYDWDATESDWTKAQYGYGAIHFHEDDLDDAAWETDVSIHLPENIRSGVYAVVVESSYGKVKDRIPFYVRPTPLTTKAVAAKVAYIISTFTVSSTPGCAQVAFSDGSS